MKKYFTLYSVLGVMVIAAMLFMHTLVMAVFYAPDGEVVPTELASAILIPVANASTSPLLVSIATSTPTATSTATATPVSNPKYPSRLLIPSLHIDANVQKVGVKKDGSMGTPNNFKDVAWYKNGVIPGDTGSAVIDGHVDNGLALAGVFKHLSDVNTGDDIYVVNATGTRIHFVVTAVDVYNYKFVPVEDIFNNRNGSHLRLVTCGGTWIPIGKTYDQRIVVTAVLKED